MFSEVCKLPKRGIRSLKKIDQYQIIVNRVLYERGRAGKFALVDAKRECVESVYTSPSEADARAQMLANR